MVSRKSSRNNRRNRQQKQRGGDDKCSSTPVLKTNDCIPEPDVTNYIFPCKNLTNNQFGFKDIASYSGFPNSTGGAKKQSRRRQQKKQQRGGQAEYPGVFGEHIFTPYSDWEIGLGENAGITTQMEADAAGPGQAGGRRRSTKQRRQQKGGCGCNYGYDDFYKTNVTQSDIKGGSKRRSVKKQQRGGNCGITVPSCLAANPIANKAAAVYDNVSLSKTAISDGSPTDLPTASELAWFFRNTYGATPSTNEIAPTQCQKGGVRRRSNKKQQRGGSKKQKQQRGGHSDQYYFGLDEKIGGLPRVDHSYGLYQPSLHNVAVTGPAPQDVSVTDELNYDLRNRTADVVGALENSSLTRDSFQIPEEMAMAGAKTSCQVGGRQQKKNYLTRKTRNHLFSQKGGDPAPFPQSFNGAQSDFSADMTTRKFDCHQPYWCPKCT